LKSRNRSDLQKHVFDGTKENFIEMKNNWKWMQMGWKLE
jgi:hypothetical protein